jgi:hypothetical protein
MEMSVDDLEMDMSVDDLPPYEHQPLAANTREIRLVELLPSEESWLTGEREDSELSESPIAQSIVLDVVHGNLEHLQTRRTRHTREGYMAFSYVWGEQNASLRRVYVRQTRGSTEQRPVAQTWSYINVRKNLFHFLWYFRDAPQNRRSGRFASGDSPPTLLWIDQLCINQKDFSERNHQVRLMASIYRNASYTITWLGSDDATCQAASTILKQKEYIKADTVRVTLLNNVYFTRLWIIQEILLSREVHIFCGSHWLEMSDLSSEEFLDPSMQDLVRGCALYLIWDYHYGRKSDTIRVSRLAKCIERYTFNSCENPRDRLYGLLGLVEDADIMQVDYARSVPSVYYHGVKVLYNGYYSEVDYFETKDQTAGYVETALTLAANMELPRDLLEELEDIEPTGDWIHRIVPILQRWNSEESQATLSSSTSETSSATLSSRTPTPDLVIMEPAEAPLLPPSPRASRSDLMMIEAAEAPSPPPSPRQPTPDLMMMKPPEWSLPALSARTPATDLLMMRYTPEPTILRSLYECIWGTCY